MRRARLTALVAVVAVGLFGAAAHAQSGRLSAADQARSARQVETLIALRQAQTRAATSKLIHARAKLLTRFEATLDAQPSATLALEQWCGARHFTDPAPARVIAQQFPWPQDTIPADTRQQLAIGPEEPIGARRVALTCGDAVLSIAYNRYAPSLLTSAMNDALANTDTPFGKVVAPLHFTRESLSSHRGPDPACPADTVLVHRARLRLPDGRVLAMLIECYVADVLADPRPIIRIPPYDPPSLPAPPPDTATQPALANPAAPR